MLKDTGTTRRGFYSTCWNAFVVGYIFHFGKAEGFIHSHTAYPNPHGSWDSTDYGPSDADKFLFRFPGINRQYIVDENNNYYEFYK